VLVAAGRLERAATILGAAAALREALGTPLPPVERDEHEARLAAVRGGLGEETFHANWNAGRAMDWEQAAAAALDDGP
jgi:hypothetical protein